MRSVLPLLAVVVCGQPTSASAQDLVPLRFQIAPVTLLRMPSWVALNEDIYGRNGLDVEQCHSMGTLNDLRALGVEPPAQYACPSGEGGAAAEGPIPITMAGGFPNFMRQAMDPAQQPRRVIILTTSNVTGWPIIARKDITTPEQLRGGRIGILGFTEIHGYQAMVFAEAMGWDSRFDMTVVEGLWGKPAFDALHSGRVDAIVAGEPAEWLASQAGYEALVDLVHWKVPMASASANADVGWLRENRETARRFVKSMVDARALMERDRGAFDRALETYFNITDTEMQDFLYADLETLPRKPYPAAEGLRKAIQLYENYFPELRRHRVEEFIDDSFVRELDESGYIDGLYE